MASIDDLVTKVHEVADDVERLILALDGVTLPSQTQAKVNAVAAKLDELNIAMDTAVPPTP